MTPTPRSASGSCSTSRSRGPTRCRSPGRTRARSCPSSRARRCSPRIASRWRGGASTTARRRSWRRAAPGRGRPRGASSPRARRRHGPARGSPTRHRSPRRSPTGSTPPRPDRAPATSRPWSIGCWPCSTTNFRVAPGFSGRRRARRVRRAVAATYELTESPPVATPDTAMPSRSEALPLLPAATVLSLQRSAGNQAVAAQLSRAPDAGPKLRTALDSKLVVSPAGSGYSAALQFGEESIAVASYAPKGDTPLNRLPVYLEDIVSGSEAVVNVRYDPAAADVKAAFQAREVDGVRITVRLQPQSVEAMTVTSAPAAKQVGADGANVDGRENVQAHSGAGATDKNMGSIASAEGGFASVEGSDAGVLTWGQGQWTVTAGELQKVLAFIKDRRRDLFDKYWGSADLDVDGKDFVHDGKKWGPAKKTMMQLFRPNVQTITAWANRFGQAGMDPQIQRLQREYLRGEVHETLGKHIGGRTPESVLDTRGQAYYYSMDKKLPSGARANFQAALKQAGLPAEGEVGAEQKSALSDALGELFKHSSVVAF